VTDPLSRKTILIIDDDRDFRDPLGILLEAEGYRVRCAGDGDHGVRMAAEEAPDLIILDLLMPVKNGFDTSRELRQIPELKDVPILALTAFGQHIGGIHGMPPDQAPPTLTACLEKPVEVNVLLDRIAAALAG